MDWTKDDRSATMLLGNSALFHSQKVVCKITNRYVLAGMHRSHIFDRLMFTLGPFSDPRNVKTKVELTAMCFL